uniref:NADH-ubiquinone oxidoreductase chain 2 n=1 Tax=Bombus filchnerae TaxID=395525 RepID=A0A8E5MDT8_9HYME|nr:NADH dehydrogenase subunit 2 [Bombus filchnerae]QTZ18834.1 NADH dehydrogenase subunit 2 [Bombus filchnerae]WKW52601.1 NADH dehydrogenase subunit 2 [Bombus filchnerae]
MILDKLLIFCLMFVMMFFINLLNSSSIFIQWLCMEFCTILLISIINIKSKNKIVSIIYFMISSISSLLLIMMISINFNQLFLLKTMNLILMMSMFLKIGMFPFCFWMIHIYKFSSWKQIFIISTFMKFIPIYFFSSLIYMTPIFLYFLIFNNLFISLYTNLEFSMKKLFGCSSIFNSTIFIFINEFNKTLFMLFFFIYIFIFFILTFMMEFYNVKNNFFNFSLKSLYLFIIMLFIYSSFPLFLTFIYKWEFTYLLNIYFSNNIVLLFLLSGFIMMWNYFILLKSLILKYVFCKNNFYKNKEFHMMNMFMYMIMFMYLFMFMLFNLM